MFDFFRIAKDSILNALYPRSASCFLCGIRVPIEGREICEHCSADLLRMKEPFCAVCGGMADFWSESEKCSNCMSRRYSFEKARSVFVYDGNVTRLIYAMKFAKAPFLSAEMAPGLLELVNLYSADCIVPVPLHKKRLQERGYNQSESLCDSIIALSNNSLPRGIIKVNALRRIINTHRQMRLSIKKRIEQMEQDVFDITESARIVEGRNVVIIDDVYTTGATVEACARALKKANPARIYVASASMARKGKVII